MMRTAWYAQDGETLYGPMGIDELNARTARGEISPKADVYTGDWKDEPLIVTFHSPPARREHAAEPSPPPRAELSIATEGESATVKVLLAVMILASAGLAYLWTDERGRRVEIERRLVHLETRDTTRSPSYEGSPNENPAAPPEPRKLTPKEIEPFVSIAFRRTAPSRVSMIVKNVSSDPLADVTVEVDGFQGMRPPVKFERLGPGDSKPCQAVCFVNAGPVFVIQGTLIPTPGKPTQVIYASPSLP